MVVSKFCYSAVIVSKDLLGAEMPQTPQILFNRELVAQPHEFDHAFLSDIDPAVDRICKALGWDLDAAPSTAQ